MHPRRLFLIVTCVLGVAAWAGDFSGKSPSGKLAFESKNEKELYLWSVDRPKARVLLYREEVVFIQAAAISPDDRWIAVECGGASLGHTILLFKHDKGLDFKPAAPGGADEGGPDIVEKVGTFALASRGIKTNILDHSYLHPVEWSKDSKWLTVALDARGSHDGKLVKVTRWRCRYSPLSQQVEAVPDNPGKVEIVAKGE